MERIQKEIEQKKKNRQMEIENETDQQKKLEIFERHLEEERLDLFMHKASLLQKTDKELLCEIISGNVFCGKSQDK